MHPVACRSTSNSPSCRATTHSSGCPMSDRAAKRLMCCFQVYGQQNRLQKYCKFFYKQHTIDKFDAVIAQLDEHSERAWQLADRSDMPVRRRGTRSSFSQGLQRDSSGLASADSVEFEKAVRPGSCSNSHPSQCCASAAEFLSAALFLSTSDFCKCGTALVVSTHTHTHTQRLLHLQLLGAVCCLSATGPQS